MLFHLPTDLMFITLKGLFAEARVKRINKFTVAIVQYVSISLRTMYGEGEVNTLHGVFHQSKHIG